MLVGEPVFRGDPGERNAKNRWKALSRAKLEAEPLDPGDAHTTELRALVRSMTEPEPEERLADAGKAAEILASMLSEELREALRVREEGAPLATRRWRSGPVAVALLGLALAVCSSLFGLSSIVAGLVGALL